MHEHPVRLVIGGDLRRYRPTVFFRLLLAIPHFIWISLWSIGMVFVVVVNWFVTLLSGTPSKTMHGWTSAYVRYTLHLNAYVYLVGNPYPGFMGEEGEYPIDLRLPERASQSRSKTFFRIFLAVPALMLASALGGGFAAGYTSRNGRSKFAGLSGRGALATTCAFFGWFACMAKGEMPKGLRDASAYSIGYGAQTLAYLLLVTDRYPDSDPTAMLDGVDRPPEHPVRVVGDPHDLRRSRVTVFFRLLIAIPHIIWLALWGIAVIFAIIANWFVTLFRGTPARPLHRFVAAYLRQRLHVVSFLTLTANPFPGFVGEYGRYPLDLELPGPAPQNRWETFFRIFLAIPALLVSGALGGALFWCAVWTWFYALARGS